MSYSLHPITVKCVWDRSHQLNCIRGLSILADSLLLSEKTNGSLINVSEYYCHNKNSCIYKFIVNKLGVHNL
jgi:hypothetical protein